jgi:hypothetical protein
VKQIVETTVPYRLATREANPSGTVVNVLGSPIGGAELVIIGEPCCVRDEEHVAVTATIRTSGSRETSSLLREADVAPLKELRLIVPNCAHGEEKHHARVELVRN